MKRSKELFLEVRQLELKQELETHKRYERIKNRNK